MGLTASELEDVQSLERVAAGDREALGVLFDRHSPLILGVLIRMLGRRDQAEHVLQDTFLKAWRDAGRYRAQLATPLGWLLTLARSQALSRLRAGAGTLSTEADASSGDAGATPQAPAEPACDDRRGRIRTALAQLPDDQRRCIELACFGGLTHAEIAARLGQPPGEVKSRIVAGMSRLRQALAPYV